MWDAMLFSGGTETGPSGPGPGPRRVTMVREHLADLPEHALPEGLSLRPYRPGDEAAWVRVLNLAHPRRTFTTETFRAEFGRDDEVIARRQLYLCGGDGVEIGTATAWFDDDYNGKSYGRVHWVAIVPTFQGLGLSRPLLSAVCRRLGELGHVRACLATYTSRVPAVGLYLKFGFVPEIRDPRDAAAWRLLRESLPDGPLSRMEL